MLQAIALREDLPTSPAFVVDAPPPPGVAPRSTERVIVPAGPFIMGTDDRRVAYDNERPAHEVELPRSASTSRRSPTAQLPRLHADGGYRRRELWTEAGWPGSQRPARVAPAALARRPTARWRRRVFGRLAPLHPDRPVVHVCWYEADAYARWAGKRLPDRGRVGEGGGLGSGAARPRRYPWGDEPPASRARANLDQRRLEPAPAGAYPRGASPYGCLQMLGDVWEWTASDFDGYPGFEALPLPRVLGGPLRPRLQGAARRLAGHAAGRRPRTRSATGTSRSAGRSSPASAVPPTFSGSYVAGRAVATTPRR